MRRPVSGPFLAMFAGSVGVLALAAGAGCANLRVAESVDADVPGPEVEGGAESGPLPQPSRDAGTDAPEGPRRFEDARQALEAKRFPGPITKPGSRGYCTKRSFVWRDTDGVLHAWTAKDQKRIDYGFKQPADRSYYVPSASLIAVDVAPSYAQLDIYRGDAVSSLVASIPFAPSSVTADDGVIRLDHRVDNVDVGGTKVRRWDATTTATTDLTTVLPTRQPPSSFVNDTLVVPGDVIVPFALYVVDVVKKTTGSVTFDGALALQQTEWFAGGLAVAYVRNSAGTALRIYKDGKDEPASRFELADEIKNRAPYFVDGNSLQQNYLARLSSWKHKILYASIFGIWAYDLPSGVLTPVQLVAEKQGAVPDVMCVIQEAGVLVYRMTNDTLGQVWAVALADVLP